jgi:hypothetical protein
VEGGEAIDCEDPQPAGDRADGKGEAQEDIPDRVLGREGGGGSRYLEFEAKGVKDGDAEREKKRDGEGANRARETREQDGKARGEEEVQRGEREAGRRIVRSAGLRLIGGLLLEDGKGGAEADGRDGGGERDTERDIGTVQVGSDKGGGEYGRERTELAGEEVEADEDTEKEESGEDVGVHGMESDRDSGMCLLMSK